MAFLEIKNLHKDFGADQDPERRLAGDRGGRLPRPGRPVRLRQVHLAQHDRRAGADHLRRNQDPRPGRRGPASVEARHRDGVPVLRALSQHDRRPEHRLRHGNPRRTQARAREGDRRSLEASADRPSARPQAEPALGRPAPARRHGPRAGAQSAGVPVRRAAVEPRRQTAHRHAHRDQAAASAHEDDDRLRHARPDRGDDAGDQDRRAEGRHPAAVRHAGGNLQQPGQHVRRRLHGLAGDEPGAGEGRHGWQQADRRARPWRAHARSCCR